MITIVRLTRAELRKLATTRAFLITLALSAGLAVISVIATAAAAGKNGAAALGTTASTDKMLKLGIIAAGGEYRHKTIIPALLATPRRGALIAAKIAGVVVAGVLLSGLTFGLGLATAVAELSAHGMHHLPADTWRLFAGSVIAGTLFGVIGVALGYLTRSTVAAIVGAVGWVLFAEQVILHTLVPHQAKWLVSSAAATLTTPVAPGALTPAVATAVLGGYAALLVAAATRLVLRRDVT